jgi:inositol transporter-like SP family MFS transporter
MASYIDSAAIVSLGYGIVIYQEVFGLTPGEVGIASGALTLGIAIGALIGGRLGDRFGRRPVFSVTMILIVVAAILLIVGESFALITVGAALMGLATGADLPVSLSTISEAATDENRGRLISFSNVLWLVGMVAALGLAMGVGDLGRIGGQILFAHLGVVAAIVFFLRLTIPESDIWLTARRERAAGVKTVRAERGSLRNLLQAPYAVPLIALVVFYSLVNLTLNTSGQFGVYLLVNVVGVDVSTAGFLDMISLPVALIGFLWFMKIADKPSRFLWFKIGAVATFLSMLVPAVFGLNVATYLIGMNMLSLGVAFAGEAIMKIWSQEQFPTLLRTTAQGTVISAARFVAAIGASVTPIIVEFGTTYLFLALTVINGIGLAVAWIVFRTRDQRNEFLEESAPGETVAA